MTEKTKVIHNNRVDAKRLNTLALEVHEANAQWWTDLTTGEPLKRNAGEMLMLMVSELAEAMKGDRKDLMDDKLPHRTMLEVEIADVVIRGLDLVGHRIKTLPRWKLYDVGRSVVYGENVAENLFMLTRDLVRLWPGADDAIIWSIFFENLIAFADHHNLDLWGAYTEKMQFNKTRADHTREARLASGGKKY